jgi:hypothetical protein
LALLSFYSHCIVKGKLRNIKRKDFFYRRDTLASPYKKGKDIDSRLKYENDVDRMINEGMAGGTVSKKYNKVHLEEARELPRENEPFPDTTESRLND